MSPLPPRGRAATPSPTSTAALPRAAATPALDPRALIAELDCTALTVDITLDNSRSTVQANFIVSWEHYPPGATPLDGTTQEVAVAAGATVVRTFPLADDLWNTYTVDSGRQLATAKGFCGQMARASVGAFNCSTLTAPVTLDNRGVKIPTGFRVQHTYDYMDHFVPEDADYDGSATLSPPYVVVPAGGVQVAQVPLLSDGYTLVMVTGGENVLRVQGLCGQAPFRARVTASTVNCRTHTVAVTIDNTRVRATSTQFRVDTSVPTRILVRAGASRTLGVALDDLPAGRLRVVEDGDGTIIYRDPVLYSATPDASCRSTTKPASHVRRGSRTAAEPTGPSLAQTGAPVVWTSLVGFALVVAGLSLGRLRRRLTP